MPASIESHQVGEVTHPVAPDFAASSPAFTNLSALIPEENELRFSTAVDRANDIEVAKKVCLESETGCCMLVTGVAEHIVEAIDEASQELGIREAARFTYEQTMESLIVRLVPGGLHEEVTSSLGAKIWEDVIKIRGHPPLSCVYYGPDTFYSAGGRRKEGDNGFTAPETRADNDGWPFTRDPSGILGKSTHPVM